MTEKLDIPASHADLLEAPNTVELVPDPHKELLPKFAARYNTPLEMLDAPHSERLAVTPVRVVTNG
jgi:hypothetical protein